MYKRLYSLLIALFIGINIVYAQDAAGLDAGSESTTSCP